MQLHEYLSQHSSKRNVDKVIIRWYTRNYNDNLNRSKEDWDKIVESFFNETEKDGFKKVSLETPSSTKSKTGDKQ